MAGVHAVSGSAAQVESPRRASNVKLGLLDFRLQRSSCSVGPITVDGLQTARTSEREGGREIELRPRSQHG